jgi:hypothetical protein
MTPYKFSKAERVPETPPDTEYTRLILKADTDEKLTRDEKDSLAKLFYGTFGCGSGTYRLAGWAYPIYGLKQIHRILVSCRHSPDTFKSYYAPDKTSLRKALNGISEMIYADNPVFEKDSDHDETD